MLSKYFIFYKEVFRLLLRSVRTTRIERRDEMFACTVVHAYINSIFYFLDIILLALTWIRALCERSPLGAARVNKNRFFRAFLKRLLTAKFYSPAQLPRVCDYSIFATGSVHRYKRVSAKCKPVLRDVSSNLNGYINIFGAFAQCKLYMQRSVHRALQLSVTGSSIEYISGREGKIGRNRADWRTDRQ